MTTTNDNGKGENSTDELKKLNELFAKRYTEEDEEYTNMARRANSPPIVDDWIPERNTGRSRQFRNGNQRRNNSQQHRNYSNDRQSYRDDPRDHRQYRDDSRDHRQYRDYSYDRRQNRDYSSHHSHHRSYSNNDRPDQYRSPTNRETR